MSSSLRIGPDLPTGRQFSPSDARALDDLRSASAETLTSTGLGQWNNPDDAYETELVGGVLWLFPTNWYDHIPIGYPIVTIAGNHKRFERDRSLGFVGSGGYLPYGLVVPLRARVTLVAPMRPDDERPGLLVSAFINPDA